MADIAVRHTLTSAFAQELVFNDGELNDGASDMYYITEITGLDGAPIRAPTDHAPQLHGGLRHDFYEGPRHIVVTGLTIVQSTRVGTAIQTIRNVMEINLRLILEDCLQDEATWEWTPAGDFSRTLSVVNEIPLQCSGVLERHFTFGLVAADPVWV